MKFDLKAMGKIKTTQVADGENGIVRYREEHPHCRYCIHKRYLDYGDFWDGFYCSVRRKLYFLNRAKHCDLYMVDTQI
jgi:hypothetical protein